MALSSFTTSAGSRGTIGAATGTALKDLGARVTTAWEGVSEVGGAALDNSLFESGDAANFIKGLPVTQNMNMAEFFDALDDPFEKDGTNKAIAEVTGINIWNTVEAADPTKIDPKLARERVNEFIAGLEQMAVNQLKDCLDSYLLELHRKNEDLTFLLDIEGFLVNEIGKLKNKVKFKVQFELDKLLYDKIKLQQVALLRQELTKAIRKICPSHNSPPKVQRLSPSLTRKINDDRSWQIVDGVKTLAQNIKEADSELAYNAQQPDSTANKLSELSKEATTNIAALSLEQTISNPDKNVFSYVSSDGELV